jgi:mRNA interferase RelE/StbE
MASYKIIWKASAGKEIYNLPRTIIPKIFNEIASLAENPRPVGSRKLRNSKNNYRIRFGDYRVIYSIFKDILIIEIIKIGHRKDIYDKLFR